MSRHAITANHQAFGSVEFTLEARDAKDAFSKFKQIVFSAKQWIVTDNGPNYFPATAPAVAAQPTGYEDLADDIEV
jgi:hypothetical protein